MEVGPGNAECCWSLAAWVTCLGALGGPWTAGQDRGGQGPSEERVGAEMVDSKFKHPATHPCAACRSWLRSARPSPRANVSPPTPPLNSGLLGLCPSLRPAHCLRLTAVPIRIQSWQPWANSPMLATAFVCAPVRRPASFARAGAQ